MSDGFITRREGNGDSGGGEDYSSFKALLNKSITEVTADMLEGITKIGEYTFNNCTSLASITIPNSVTIIDGYAFSNCDSLASIIIPNNVTSIGYCAFYHCTSLSSITVEATSPPILVRSYGYDAFRECTNLDVFYVPAESVDAYKASIYWSKYADKIQAIPSEQLGGS